MTSRQRRVQTLYEISLAIETRETLEETADQALAAYLQKLNCSVGGVFETTDSSAADPTLIESIPANPDRNALFQAGRDHLTDIINRSQSGDERSENHLNSSPTRLSNTSTNDSLSDAFPTTTAVEDTGTFYLFELPEFGVLLLGKRGGSLSTETVYALNSLNEQLAQACRANRRERALRKQRDRFEAIFTATTEPTVNVVVSDDGTERLQRANDAFKSTFGYDDETLRGRDLNELITPHDQQRATETLLTTLKAGDPFRREVRRKAPSGIRYFLFTAVPVTTSTQTEYFGVYVDITDQRERELTLQELYATAQDVLTGDSRQRICKTVAETVESVLGHTNASVHLYNRDSGALEPIVSGATGSPGVGIASAAYANRDSVLWDAYQTGEAVRVTDTSSLDDSLLTEKAAVESAVAIPIENHGVVFATAAKMNNFADEDVYFLRVLCQLTSIGLDRQLNEAGLKTTQKTARRALQQQSHEDMAESVLTEIPHSLNMPLMGIWKYRPARQQLEPLAMTEYSDQLLGDPPSFSSGESLAWQAFNSDTTFASGDVSTHPDVHNPETPIEEEVLVPIGDFGVLIAGSTHAESFSDIDIEMLDSLGTNLEVITEVIDSRRDVKLLNQVIARILRHNVRNKLTTIMGYTSQIESTADEPIKGYAQRVLDSCHALEKTSRHAREMRKIVNSRSKVTRISLDSAVRSAASEIKKEFPDGEINIDLQDTPTVTAHPEFTTALAHLVRNGFEHNHSDAPRVNISVQTSDETTSIQVSDNGPGIDPYELNVIKNHEESALEHGSGAGLWIVDRVVQYSEAALEIDCDNGTAATITFH